LGEMGEGGRGLGDDIGKTKQRYKGRLLGASFETVQDRPLYPFLDSGLWLQTRIQHSRSSLARLPRSVSPLRRLRGDPPWLASFSCPCSRRRYFSDFHTSSETRYTVPTRNGMYRLSIRRRRRSQLIAVASVHGFPGVFQSVALFRFEREAGYDIRMLILLRKKAIAVGEYFFHKFSASTYSLRGDSRIPVYTSSNTCARIRVLVALSPIFVLYPTNKVGLNCIKLYEALWT
jgi:hypothetical protein